MSERPLGPYLIEERLATGGMAEVFVAKRLGPHGFFKRVALKRILPQFARDPDFVSMFVDEARLAARLEHPNVVQVFDFGELNGDLFLAMELVVGTNVNRLLRTVSTRGESVPLETALHILAQTAHALAYAHRARGDDGKPLGIVHRDVSPANLLLTHTGHVKLSDFGIARMSGKDNRTDDGHVRGKLGYMSPEQVMGKELDGRSDVFTLTTVFAEMLLAEPLFGTGSDLDVLIRIRDSDLRVLDRSSRRIPQDVLRLIRMGLMPKASERPSSSAFVDLVDDVMRRRGIVRGPDRLARVLLQLDLVRGNKADSAALEAGARPTWTLDTTGLAAPTEQLGKVGMKAPEIYRVRREDGTVVGPVSYPKLVQMITSGEIDAECLVSRESGDFDSAAALPELARFVTSPALQWRAEETTYATRRGFLGSARLLSVVHRIAADEETGVLHLFERRRRKKIYFVDGRPEFVASTDKNELLGEYLVATGVCLRMEVEMALALLPRYGGRLGDALVGLGILRPVELFRAVSAQVRAKYLEAFRWRTGEWAYVPDVRSQEETYPLAHDCRELLRDAALEAHPEELEAVLSAVREKVLVKSESPVVPLSAYRVPEQWHRILDVQGDSTLGAIVARESLDRGLDTEEVYRAFYLGLSCDIVRAA